MFYVISKGKCIGNVSTIDEFLKKFTDSLLLTWEEMLVYRTPWQMFWPRIKRYVVTYDYEHFLYETEEEE